MKFDFDSLAVSKVRLVGGTASYEGRVEIYRRGEWGTVCDNGWDINDATVLCRQLGYSRAVAAKLSAYYGLGSGKIWMDVIDCRGNETELHHCPLQWRPDSVHMCNHFKDAGVICGKTTSN